MTSNFHNRKNKKSSDFMYEAQITIKNATIWFSFSLTRLALYCLKVFLWKVLGNAQQYTLKKTGNCKQLSPVITWIWLFFSLLFNIFMCFHHPEFSSSCWHELLLKLRSRSPIFSQFLWTFFQRNLPTNQLTSIANSPIHAVISPRSYISLIELISLCIK